MVRRRGSTKHRWKLRLEKYKAISYGYAHELRLLCRQVLFIHTDIIPPLGLFLLLHDSSSSVLRPELFSGLLLSRINILSFPRGKIWFPHPFMGFLPCFYLVSPSCYLNYPKWMCGFHVYAWSFQVSGHHCEQAPKGSVLKRKVRCVWTKP